MVKRFGIRLGAIASDALVSFVHRGGVMSKESFRGMMLAQCPSPDLFRSRVVRPLEDNAYIELRGGSYVATQLGKDFVVGADAVLDAGPQGKYVGQPAAPRVAMPERPLNVARLIIVSPHREGALDYRAIPLLMGGKRIVHGGNLTE